MAFSFFESNTGLYIRQAQFFIFPLRESFGPQNSSTAVVLNSSGKNTDLRIAFRSDKHLMAMGTPNKLQVELYNLSAETKQLLSKQATNITLQAGYEQGDSKLQIIGRAGITSSVSDRDGPHIKTTVKGFDGMDGLAQAVSSRAYTNSVRLRKIVQDLAKDIPGVEVSELNLKIDNNLVVGDKGRILSGRTSNLLSKLAREFGFNWSIDDGVFKAFDDVFITGIEYTVSTANQNLISASPRVDDITQGLIGVDIQSILDARIKPGDIINLKSDINPLVNGKYQATAVSHVGDTHGKVWQSSIQCILNDRQRFTTATSANAAFQRFN